MTRTLNDRLDDVCSARGLRWWGTSDSSARTGPRSPKHLLLGPFWICAYEPTRGNVAALITGAPGWTAAKGQLLETLDRQLPPPELEQRQDGVVVERIKSHLLTVEFVDGTTTEFAYPYIQTKIEPGSRLSPAIC